MEKSEKIIFSLVGLLVTTSKREERRERRANIDKIKNDN